MHLTHDNYHSREANREYMSYSQFVSFDHCEARALAELNGEYQVDKDCYREGHLFEALLNGTESEFLAQNPDMISSQGPTKGQLKSNYKRVVGAADAFKRQQLFMDCLKGCRQQVIATGIIGGVAFKGCIDYLADNLDSFDTKAMANFKKVWSDADSSYLNWYYSYGFHYQASLYNELIRQQNGKTGTPHILAATKEEIPDVAAIEFSRDRLNAALDIIKEFAPRYAAIKRGEIEPTACGKCDYCKSRKVIKGFEIVEEYE